MYCKNYATCSDFIKDKKWYLNLFQKFLSKKVGVHKLWTGIKKYKKGMEKNISVYGYQYTYKYVNGNGLKREHMCIFYNSLMKECCYTHICLVSRQLSHLRLLWNLFGTIYSLVSPVMK